MVAMNFNVLLIMVNKLIMHLNIKLNEINLNICCGVVGSSLLGDALLPLFNIWQAVKSMFENLR